MAYDYGTIVIGGGPGGLAAAYGLAAKQKVLVVENDLWAAPVPTMAAIRKKCCIAVSKLKMLPCG